MLVSLDPQKYPMFIVVASYPYTFQKPNGDDQDKGRQHLPPIAIVFFPHPGSLNNGFNAIFRYVF